MRYRSLRKFVDIPKSEGLVFFAQLLEELLFKYSLDTYKPSAMNTCGLCNEAIVLISDIEEEIIDKGNLTHVLDELQSSLSSDEIAKSLLGDDHESFSRRITMEADQIESLKITLNLMYSQISRQRYKDEAEVLLASAVREGREKTRIRHLTRNYVTSLANLGYSDEYLYSCIQQCFHSGKRTIRGPEDIELFFSYVRNKNVDYKIIVRASSIFGKMRKPSTAFGLEAISSLSGEDEKHALERNYSLEHYSNYVLLNVQAKDVFAALDGAQNILSFMGNQINMYYHKEIPMWDERALIINSETDRSRLVKKRENAMLLCVDSHAQNAAKKLDSFVNDFSMDDSHSFQRYFNATELHSLALKNDSQQNQLLNLWMALETLAPSKSTRNKAKINTIIDSVLPFISHSYIPTLLSRLVKDFILWNRKAFETEVASVQGDSLEEKLTRTLLLEENEHQKNSLNTALGDFYLLRNRAHQMAETLSSSAKIHSLLLRHSKRVELQLRRIYRARNLIVHSGVNPPYTSVLIKNTHDYLDIVTGAISRLASGEKVNSIDQAFKYAEISFEHYMHTLKSARADIDSNNLMQFLPKMSSDY